MTYNSTFGITICMMIAAIIYVVIFVDNPKAFIEMKAAQKTA